MDETARSQDDFAIAFESSFGRFQVRIEEVCAGYASWSFRVAAAIEAAFELAATDPAAASVLTREALAAGPSGVARYRRLLAYIAGKLAPGREQRPEGNELPPLTEQALAGGLIGVAAERLARGRAADLPALAPQAIQFALTPYLGVREAKRIAASTELPDLEDDR